MQYRRITKQGILTSEHYCDDLLQFVKVLWWKINCHSKRAHAFVFKDNLSFKKDASQFHTSVGTGYGAENAVDGNTATCMRTREIGRYSPYKTVWWKVDLGGVYNIYSVNILFKNYDRHGIKCNCVIIFYQLLNYYLYIVTHLMFRYKQFNLKAIMIPREHSCKSIEL